MTFFIRLSFAVLLIVLQSTVYAELLVGKVVGVSDGDTITLLDAKNQQYKVRLSGIDAPEKTQPFGQASKKSLSELIFNKDVEISWDKRDRYQRILGKVLLNGQDICLVQIKRGMAWHYKKYQRDQTADDRLSYAQAETQARAIRIGLWIDDSPVQPSDFRHKK